MAFQPCTDTASAVLHMTAFDGKQFDTVFHFNLTGTLTQAIADTVAAELASDVDDIKAYIFSGNSWTGVTVTDLRTEGAPEFFSASGFPVTGTSGADPLPNQIAACIKWLTSFRGKSGRGRSFIGGWTEDAVTSGVMAAGLKTALEEFGDDIVSNGSATFVVLSRFHDKAARANGINHAITGRSVDPMFRTQRRRIP